VTEVQTVALPMLL